MDTIDPYWTTIIKKKQKKLVLYSSGQEDFADTLMPVLALGQLLFGSMLQTAVAPLSWISQGNVIGSCWLKPVDDRNKRQENDECSCISNNVAKIPVILNK